MMTSKTSRSVEKFDLNRCYEDKCFEVKVEAHPRMQYRDHLGIVASNGHDI